MPEVSEGEADVKDPHAVGIFERGEWCACSMLIYHVANHKTFVDVTSQTLI